MMHDKITLYEEILAQDPNARIFFPLAGMYRDEGRLEEAAELLTRGLASHPEHMEARCLLLELQKEMGRDEQARETTRKILAKLSNQGTFWRTWSEICVEDGKSDLGLAVQFIASEMEGTPLKWADILAAGMAQASSGSGTVQEKADEEQGATPENRPHEDSIGPADDEMQSLDIPGIKETDSLEEITPEAGDMAQTDESQSAAEAPPFHEVPEFSGKTREPFEPPDMADLVIPGDPLFVPGGNEPEQEQSPVEAAEDEEDRPDDTEEATPRTRTMADLLLEQGDREKALEIYRELWESEPPGEERRQLESILLELQGGKPTGTNSEDQGQEKTEVIDFLEGLAKRLESRTG